MSHTDAVVIDCEARLCVCWGAPPAVMGLFRKSGRVAVVRRCGPGRPAVVETDPLTNNTSSIRLYVAGRVWVYLVCNCNKIEDSGETITRGEEKDFFV